MKKKQKINKKKNGRPISEKTKLSHAKELSVEQLSNVLREKVYNILINITVDFDDRADSVNRIVRRAAGLSDALKQKFK